MQITLKDDTELLSVKTKYGHDIAFYNDWPGTLWVYSCEYGPCFVVAAQTFDSAYESIMDELKTIDASEDYEAYGFDSDADFKAAVEADSDSLALNEGYQYQSNSTGTGIVNVGYYESLSPLTSEFLKESGIQLEVGAM